MCPLLVLRLFFFNPKDWGQRFFKQIGSNLNDADDDDDNDVDAGDDVDDGEE